MFDFFKRRKSPPAYAPTITFNTRVEQFWEWFESRAGDFDAMMSGDAPPDSEALAEEVGARVSACIDGMAWCFGPAMDTSGHHLALSPEGHTDRLLLATLWQASAPALPRWEFYAAKPGQPTPGGSLCFGEVTVDFPNLMIALVPQEEYRRPAVHAWHPAFADAPEGLRAHATIIALDETLGELANESWIAGVEILDEPATGAFPIGELPEKLDQFYAVMEWPKANPLEDWRMYQLEPRDDDTRHAQGDSFTKITRAPSLVMEFIMAAGSFDDPTLANGAACLYVALPVSMLRRGHETDDRGTIEEALESALMSQGLGLQIGAGLGQEFAYIDLLITDGPRSIEAIQAVLRQQQAPLTTEIRFYDQSLADVVYHLH